MRLFFTSILILGSLCLAFAQNKSFSTSPAAEGEKKTSLIERDSVYQSADRYPEYPGGDDALVEYISNHLDYPPEAKRQSQQGTTQVKFVIRKDGSVGEVHVAKSSSNPLLDKEAVRIVKSIKHWKPAQKGGKPVSIWHTIPIQFILKQEP